MSFSSGEILLDGKPVIGPGAERGVVFQKHALMPWLNVVENVEFGLKMRGVDKAERRRIALEKLAAVGLEKFAESPVYQISGGMQQRVGLARSLASDPEVMLMDEPLGALDALTREKQQELILQLWWQTQENVLLHHAQRRGGAVPCDRAGRDDAVAGPHLASLPARLRAPLHRVPRRARGEVRLRVHSHPRGSAAGDSLGAARYAKPRSSRQ